MWRASLRIREATTQCLEVLPGFLLPLLRAVFLPSFGTGSCLYSLASKCPGGTSPVEEVR